MRKGFATIFILIGILAIVSIVGGVYNYFSKQGVKTPATTAVRPTTQPATGSAATANWKTYDDKSSNYSIKYPSDWNAINNVEVTNFGKGLTGFAQFDKLKMYLTISAVESNESYPDAKSKKDFWVKVANNTPNTNLIQSSLTFAGINWYKIEKSDPNLYQWFMIGQSKNIIYEISFSKLGQSILTSEEQSIRDKIISTFKFTN